MRLPILSSGSHPDQIQFPGSNNCCQEYYHRPSPGVFPTHLWTQKCIREISITACQSATLTVIGTVTIDTISAVDMTTTMVHHTAGSDQP